MGTATTDKCPHCNGELTDGHNSIYFYCKQHPTYIKYDDDKWNKWLTEQNNKEWESLRRLEKD